MNDELVYNEDLVKRVKNKYLAVNVAATRARDINANGLPIAPSNAAGTKKKPVAIATQELVDGKLHFEKGEAKMPVPNTPSIFADPLDTDDEGNIFGEEVLLEREYDSEPEEREEGI